MNEYLKNLKRELAEARLRLTRAIYAYATEPNQPNQEKMKSLQDEVFQLEIEYEDATRMAEVE